MCHRYFYRAIPCTIAFLTVLDAILWLSRLLFFTIPSTPSTENRNSTLISPFYSSNQAFAALAFDCIGSALSIVLVVYLALSIGIYAVVITPIWFVEQISSDPKKKTRMSSWQLCIANLRFITLTCNCPCYTPRPELRFYVRLGTLFFFLLMRTISMILYATLNINSILSTVIAIISGIATLVIYLTAALDYYRYRMWCNYTPEGIYKPCRIWCCAQKFHPSHLQFLPAPLLGTNRDPDQLGNQPCRNQSNSCNELTLQHIAIFHSFDFKPQKRYDPSIHKTFFGFHQTTIDATIGISQTGFRISDTPPQMLGFGVYFARSFAGTEGKARRKGAWILAEINLKRVLRVTNQELPSVCNSNAWWKNYDTVYYDQENEDRDEFCVKDPAQILRWIIIVNDNRLHQYKLREEISNTVCGCI